MDTERKVEILINMMPLVPYVVQGVTEAVVTFNKMVIALKDGVTKEEWEALLADTDAVIDRVIAKTAEG